MDSEVEYAAGPGYGTEHSRKVSEDRVKLKLGIACGVLALGLVGCGGEDSDEPAASATPSSPTSTATASGEPSPTVDPKKETAKEFIRRWVQVYNHMVETGRTDEIRAVTDVASCNACKGFINGREAIHEAGGWVETKGWRVTSIARDLGSRNGASQWSVVFYSAPSRWADYEGAEVETTEGQEYDRKFNLFRNDRNHWVLQNIWGARS